MNKLFSTNSLRNKYSDLGGVTYVVLAGICWGIISIFIRNLAAFSYTSLQIIFFRAWFSAFMLMLYFLIRNPKLLIIDPKDLWMFLGSGLLSLTLFSYCYFQTILTCGAAIAVVLLYTSPIFVMLMSALFFKEKLNRTKIISLVISIVGSLLVAGITGSSQRIDTYSLLIGLTSGFGYALYSIFANVAVRKYSSLTITFYTLLISGIGLAFICKPLTLVNTFDIHSLPWLIGVAFFCTVIPYIFYTKGLKNMDPGRAAVLVTVEPLVGCMLGILAFNEPYDIFKIIGIVLIFTAIILLSKN